MSLCKASATAKVNSNRSVAAQWLPPGPLGSLHLNIEIMYLSLKEARVPALPILAPLGVVLPVGYIVNNFVSTALQTAFPKAPILPKTLTAIEMQPDTKPQFLLKICNLSILGQKGNLRRFY